MTAYLRKAKFRCDRRLHAAVRPGRPGSETDRSYYGSDCDERILRRGYERAGAAGRHDRAGNEVVRGNSELPAENGELPRVFGVDKWARW